MFLLQHNLATTVDKEKVLEAYNDVMSDAKADINWSEWFLLNFIYQFKGVLNMIQKYWLFLAMCFQGIFQLHG